MALTLVTAPVREPLTLDEAKPFLRVSTDEENAIVNRLSVAAREYAETFTRRALLTQVWDWKLDGFPCGVLELPIANVTAIGSITYIDQNGDSQTWSSALYQTDLPVGPKAPFGRIVPAYGQSWPSTRDQMNAVTVRFTAGYGSDPDAVPSSLITAMQTLVTHWFTNREPVAVGVGIGAVAVPLSIDGMLWPYRAWSRYA